MMSEEANARVASANLTWPDVATRLDQAGLRWAVFAGAAAHVYGATRPITDIDILIRKADDERVAALLPEAEVERRNGEVFKLVAGDCDLVPGVGTIEPDDEMVARMVRYNVREVLAPVVPVEDNIAIKALMNRGPEVGKHDWEDIRAMMVHARSLDWSYLRWRLVRSLPVERLELTWTRLEALA